MSFNMDDFATLLDFADEVKVSPLTLKKHMEAAGVKPVRKFGNTNVYLKSDMRGAIDSQSSVGKSARALGYVHPDQHAEAVRRRDELVRENIERDAEIELLSRRVRKLEALETAGVDSWSGYDHAMDILNGDENDDSE